MKPKARYFTFLIYPDSAPEDWLDRLEILDIPIAISPLHDKDAKEGEEGGFKKPHYHVIYVSPNPVTADAVRKRVNRAFETNKAINLVQIVQRGIESMYLYLTHESKDAIKKGKYVYDEKEIICLNGFDIDRYIPLDTSDKRQILRDVKDFIIKYECANIIEFERMYRIKGDIEGLPSWEILDEVIDGHTGVLRLYFDGVYQTIQMRYKNQGEVSSRD